MEYESNLQFLGKLGEGSYGSVHRAKVISTGQIIAVKVIQMNEEDEGINSTSIREITILQSLTHPNIIKLLGYQIQMTEMNPRIELYFDFMDEDLSKMMKKQKIIDQTLIKSIMRQILDAVIYMHRKNVFHRDLKPHNILIDQTGTVKIADFGLGRITGTKMTTMSKEIETLWYRAPELLLGNLKYDYAVDIWSLGCIFFELAEGRVRFQTESEIGQIMEIMQQQGTPSVFEWNEITNLPFFKRTFPKFIRKENKYENLDSQGIDLLECMLIMNPKKRITLEEARKHDYFK